MKYSIEILLDRNLTRTWLSYWAVYLVSFMVVFSTVAKSFWQILLASGCTADAFVLAMALYHGRKLARQLAAYWALDKTQISTIGSPRT